MRRTRRRRDRGSALILAVVLTVLLALIGVFFVMASRVGEVASSTQVEHDELDEAVDAVVAQIQYKLWEDLFVSNAAGAGSDPDTYFEPNSMNLLAEMSDWAFHPSEPNSVWKKVPDFSTLSIDNEPWDSPAVNPNTSRRSDAWLASLMPELLTDNGTGQDTSDDIFRWPYITDLTGRLATLTDPASGQMDRNLFAAIVKAYQEDIDFDPDTDEFDEGTLADADGDGFSDSRWVKIDGVGGSRGQGVYAAVRITDNCGRVNLNTAYERGNLATGKYLSSVSLVDFMRSDPNGQRDNFFAVRPGGGFSLKGYHDVVITDLASGDTGNGLFGLSEELELRNRFMLSSPFTARFETAYVGEATFDSAAGIYAALTIPAQGLGDYAEWTRRMNPANFDGASGAWISGDGSIDYKYRYDRRPICTFYSFDRDLQRMAYPDPSNTDFYDPAIYYYDQDTHRVEVRDEMRGVVVPEGGLDMGVELVNDAASRRWVLQLLYAMRAYYLDKGASKTDAAKAAAQFVVNLIDYMDDHNEAEDAGPFFDPFFGGQRDEIIDYSDPNNLTGTGMNSSVYLTADIINRLELEQGGSDLDTLLDFGLTSMVVGYERQPFITEVFRKVGPNPGDPSYYAVELANPYENPNGNMHLTGWRLVYGTNSYQFKASDNAIVPKAEGGKHGRLVITNDLSQVPIKTGTQTVYVANLAFDTPVVQLYKPGPEDLSDPAKQLLVDQFEVHSLLSIDPAVATIRTLQRDDNQWRLADARSYYEFDDSSTLGEKNDSFVSVAKNFPLKVADWNRGLESVEELAGVIHQGHGPSGLRDELLTWKVLDYDNDDLYFDFMDSDENILAYLGLANLNGLTRVPGRINLNTATREVIRAAIPDLSATDPTWPGYDAMATNIVNYRSANNVFAKVNDLMNVQDVDPDPSGTTLTPLERVERYSAMANKFTVRSDVFSAYVLVRLGVRGPQQRVIAIFDRGDVYSPWQKPRIVAVHPVPAPR